MRCGILTLDVYIFLRLLMYKDPAVAFTGMGLLTEWISCEIWCPVNDLVCRHLLNKRIQSKWKRIDLIKDNSFAYCNALGKIFYSKPQIKMLARPWPTGRTLFLTLYCAYLQFMLTGFDFLLPSELIIHL